MTRNQARQGFQSREVLSLAFALGIVLLIALLSYQSWSDFARRADELEKTQRIVTQANRLLSAIEDAETGQRGFLLTGRESYLEPYRRAIVQIPSMLNRLAEAAQGRQDQTRLVAELRQPVQIKLNELQHTLDVRRREGLAAALKIVETDEGKRAMDQIRSGSGEIQAVATARLNRFAESSRGSANKLGIIATAGSAALFGLLAVAAIMIHRGMKRRESLYAALEESEKTASESRDWLEAVLRSTGDAVIVVGAEGRVRFMNGVAEQLTGWTQGESEGRPLDELFVIHNEESGQPVQNPAKTALAEGRIVGLANHTVLTSRDGRRIPIDDSAAPIRGASGGVEGVVLIFRDVTTRKEAEAQLKATNERLRALLNASPIGVLAGDVDGNVREANDALLNLIGYTRDELNAGAVNWKTITPPDLLHLDEKGVAEAKQKGVCTPYEKLYVRKDGSTVPVYVGFALLGEERRESVAFIVDLSAQKLAEQKLNQQLRFTKAITDNAAAALFIVDEQQRCIFLNPAAERLTGYTLSELRDQSLHQVIHRFTPDGEEIPPEECEIVRALFTGMQKQGEAMFQHKDGHFYPVAYISSPLRNESGGLGAVVEVHGIWAQKLAEEALRESEARFRQLAESMPQVVWITSPDGTCEYVNQRWTELTGCGLAETQAGVFRRDMLAADVELMDRAFRECIRHRQPYSLECRFRRKSDGELRWHLVRAVPVRNDAGQVIRWLGTSTDIHDQKRAEEENRFRAEELETFLDATPAFIWITRDSQCRLIVGNRAASELFSVQPGVNVSLTTRDQAALPRVEFKPDGTPYQIHELPIQRAVATRKEIVNAEIEFRFPDGRRVHTVGNATPLFDDANNVRGCVAAFLDITNLKRAERELIRANEDLRQFAFAASHDLQEPLRMITTYSQLLVRGVAKHALDGEADMCVNVITDGAKRMRDLLIDLLAYTQLSDNGPPAAQLVDLNGVLEDVLGNMRAAILENHVDIDAGMLPAIQGERAHFVQLFQNLIANAIKYRGEGAPRIRISAESNHGVWEIAISDNGIGIDPQYHRTIFGVFKRLHGKSTPGTGIGLAICQRVVERYGGRIWVESESGTGSTFRFTLPHARVVEQPALEVETIQ